ncbi:acetolactate synthase small subunit [Trueperella pyogenes]
MTSRRRTLSVLVENKPGVLARVSGLFARRAFNIHSLAVGPTDRPELSRITLVVDTDEAAFEQITKQLINVIKITELERDLAVQRKLILAKVRADDTSRTNVIQVVELFRAKIVDVVPGAVTIEATGSDSKITALLDALEPYGVKEIVQSGSVAISRGARSMTEAVTERKQLRGV